MSKPGHGGDCPYCLQLQREFPRSDSSGTVSGYPGNPGNWSDQDWKYRPISYRIYDGDTILDLVLDLGSYFKEYSFDIALIFDLYFF